MQNKKIKNKIVVTIAIIISILPISLIIIALLVVNIFQKLHGFHDDKFLIDKYSYIFEPYFRNKNKIDDSLTSKTYGSICYYQQSPYVLCIMEFSQFSNVELNSIKIKNYELKGENEKILNPNMTFTSVLQPHLITGLYGSRKKAKNINIYMKNKIIDKIKNDKYFYMKFEGKYLSISSTEEYPDLSCFLLKEEDPFIELLILKVNDKRLIIMKYLGLEKDNSKENITLLEMIDKKYLE